MENDNGDRLCQWRWLALTPVALSVLLFSFLVVLTRFFFSEVGGGPSSRFEKKIATNTKKNIRASPNLGEKEHFWIKCKTLKQEVMYR